MEMATCGPEGLELETAGKLTVLFGVDGMTFCWDGLLCGALFGETRIEERLETVCRGAAGNETDELEENWPEAVETVEAGVESGSVETIRLSLAEDDCMAVLALGVHPASRKANAKSRQMPEKMEFLKFSIRASKVIS